MSSNPNTRLKEVFEALPVTYNSIANESGISKSTWQRAMSEGGHIGIDILVFLSEHYDVDNNYIVTGEYDKSVQTSGQNEGVPTLVRDKSVQTSEHQANEEGKGWDPEEFVSVPFYPQVYASGGQGLIAENEQSLPITFRRYFFSNTITASPANCFMIRIKGDSMHPLYPDGADLLVDRARQRIKEGPGFLVRVGDSLYCKLLRTIPGGGIEMRSKNEDYHPVNIAPEEKDFEVIGEVVWHAAKSKYI